MIAALRLWAALVVVWLASRAALALAPLAGIDTGLEAAHYRRDVELGDRLERIGHLDLAAETHIRAARHARRLAMLVGPAGVWLGLALGHDASATRLLEIHRGTR